MRFPEFEGEWEKYKVSDILEFFPTNSLSWDQLEYGINNIYNLHYGLIHKGLPTQIELNKYSLPNIKKDFTPKNYTLCKDGDVAFADASEDTNDVGKVVEFLNCENNNIVCGLHTIHGRDKKDLTIRGFKGYAFSSVIFRHQIRRIAQGTKIYSISPKNFNEIYIGIPSKKEQAKISSLLQLLDERIETQNKIIEDLRKLKTALVDRLFANKGEPSLRYPRFLENWVQYTYGDLFQVSTERNSDYSINRILSASQTKGMIERQEMDINIQFEQESTRIYKIVYPGDYIVHLRSFQGGFAFSEKGGICSPAYTVLRPSKKLEYAFMKEFFMSSRFIKSLKLVTYGIRDGRSISVEEFLKLPISIPSLEEQTKIIKILETLESKILNESEIYSLLRIQKQNLLCNMFI